MSAVPAVPRGVREPGRGQAPPVRVYADTTRVRTRQAVGDLLVLLGCLVAALVGRSVHGAVSALGAPGRRVEAAGEDLEEDLAAAGEAAGGVPVVGDALSAPLRAAAGAARGLAEAGAAETAAAERLALLLGLLVALLPCLVLLGARVPRRVRWSREATAAGRLPDAVLAARAVAGQPLPALARLGPAVLDGWRDGEPAAVARLADLERGRLGLH